MSERVILAYSGGLDTSVAISWIGKETGREVVAVAIDLGQGGEDMERRPATCARLRRGRGRRRRRPRRVRRRVLPADHQVATRCTWTAIRWCRRSVGR